MVIFIPIFSLIINGVTLKLIYFMLVNVVSFYSYLLQAIFRLCRIVFHTEPLLQSFNLYIGEIILQ